MPGHADQEAGFPGETWDQAEARLRRARETASIKAPEIAEKR
jgi:hypothetical protein